MKYTLHRTVNEPIDAKVNWKIEKVTLQSKELIPFLRQHLIEVMEGILDPDTAGKSPDRYLENLQSGRLGDFSKRYIISAYDDKKVIGLLIGLPKNETTLHILTVGVVKSYRKKGIGTALLSRCVEDMSNSKMNSIILDVHSDNEPARSLYDKLGFVSSN